MDTVTRGQGEMTTFRVAGVSPRARVAGKTSSGHRSRQSGIRYGLSGTGSGAGTGAGTGAGLNLDLYQNT